MPLYNTATTASALGVNPKWLDNLLSHNDLDGLPGVTQGVARRLSLASVLIIALSRDLAESLGIPSGAALTLATRILETQLGEMQLSPSLRLVVDLDALRTHILANLARAVEVAPTPRRGRPPKR